MIRWSTPTDDSDEELVYNCAAILRWMFYVMLFPPSHTPFRDYVVVYALTGALHGRALKTYSVTQTPSTTPSAATDYLPSDSADVL